MHHFRSVPQPASQVSIGGIIVDGDGSDWGGVPVSEINPEGDLVEYLKIAQTDGMFYMLVKCRLDSFDYHNFGVGLLSLLDGSDLGFGDSSGSVNYQLGDNGLFEISYNIPSAQYAHQLCVSSLSIYGETYSGGVFDGGSGEYRLIGDLHGGYHRALQPVNDFLSDHPLCMSQVRSIAKMDTSRTQLSNALEVARLADQAVIDRVDALMHFIEYDPLYADEQQTVREYMYDLRVSLNNPHAVTVDNYTEVGYLGAFFESSYVLRDLIPQLSDDNEIIHGTIPDPTMTGILPDATEQRWHDELYGRVPMVRESVFNIDGKVFSTGGYAYWNQEPDMDGVTGCAQSGILTNQHLNVNAYATWLETTFVGPGTLNFSWGNTNTVSSSFLCIYVNGMRQYGSLRGENGWGPRQITLGDGNHTVRWAYIKDETSHMGQYYDPADDLDAKTAMIGNLEWTGGLAGMFTSTPTPVPYSWLDQFVGLVSGADGFEQAASGDQDGDGMLTWEEFVAGTIPTDRDSRFIATIDSTGSDLLIGWEPDLSPNREYQVEGKESLTDDWSPTNNASRFFRVKVLMP